ncbi:hypothetical protein Tco_0706087 [Tanacetum coccineum]|uniref:peptidylprolyl isomerase n=1 Tax=Tanacetum coccineum TaxID=301880 RepID=A0ABQ4Y804_9ASTR
MDTSKTKDNIKARKDREIYCDPANLHTWSKNNKIIKPKASYTLTKPQVKKVCEWVKEVIFPDGYASNIGGCVNLKDCSFYSFKSHECHVFMQRLLPIALKGMIPNAIWDAITELCTFFHTICTKVLHIQDMEKLGESIVVTICKLLEKVFPPGFFDSMENLVMHLANEAILGDPVRETSPYIDVKSLSIAREEKFVTWFKEHVFERLNGNYEHLKGLARGPLRNVKSYVGYLVNGYKFPTKKMELKEKLKLVCLVTEGEIEEIPNDYVHNAHLPVSDDEQEFIDRDDDDSNEDVYEWNFQMSAAETAALRSFEKLFQEAFEIGAVKQYSMPCLSGCWDEGVLGMQLGEVARLRCSPDYAYGGGEFPAWGIHPNSTLACEIEVLRAQ